MFSRLFNKLINNNDNNKPDLIKTYHPMLKNVFDNIILKKLLFVDLESLKKVNKYCYNIVMIYYGNNVNYKYKTCMNKILHFTLIMPATIKNMEIYVDTDNIVIPDINLHKLTIKSHEIFLNAKIPNVYHLTLDVIGFSCNENSIKKLTTKNYVPLVNFKELEYLHIQNVETDKKLIKNIINEINSLKKLKYLKSPLHVRHLNSTLTGVYIIKYYSSIINLKKFQNIRKINGKVFNTYAISKNNKIEKIKCSFETLTRLNENLTYLNFQNYISDVSLEKFVNLKILKVETDRVIDITKNKIEKLKFTGRGSRIIVDETNNIKKLSVDHQSNVTGTSNFNILLNSLHNIESLEIKNSGYTSINLTNNKKLNKFKFHGENPEILIQDNNIKYLSMKLSCGMNKINLENFKNLEKIKVFQNCKSLDLNLQNNVKLKYIDIIADDLKLTLPEYLSTLKKIRVYCYTYYGGTIDFKNTNALLFITGLFYKNAKAFPADKYSKFDNIHKSFNDSTTPAALRTLFL